MQFLEAAPRRELQKFAKEWGIKANIKSDEIREQLLEKGFTAPGRSSTKHHDNQSAPENQPPASPRAPSASEEKLKGLQNRMKMRRGALHVQNGESVKDVANPTAEMKTGTAFANKNQRNDADTKTPLRGRASTVSKYYTPASGEPETPSSATVLATPAKTFEQSAQSSKPTGARGIPSTPPPPPPHLATPGSKQQQGIPSKRADVKVTTPSLAQGPVGPSYLPRSPVNSISGESTSPQPPNLTPSSTPAQTPQHIADMPATAAALQRLKSNRTGSRPTTAVSVPSHLLANGMESGSQMSADTTSAVPGSSSPARKTGNQGKSATRAAGRTPPASPGADGADSQRPSSTNSAGRTVKHVPVHLKKKPIPGLASENSAGSEGVSDCKEAEEKPARRAVRDTLGLSKRRKPMHSQPINTGANASVPPVPLRPLRPQSGPTPGSQKSKSMGAGTAKVSVDVSVSPPLRISRSPAARRGVGGRNTSVKRRTSVDRAGKRGGKGEDSTPEKTPPPRRSISVEPQPLASRARRAVTRGAAAVARSSSAFDSNTSRDPSSTPERESSKASVGTSATTSNPGSVAAALLGGSLADRLGRGGTAGSQQGGPTAESTLNKAPPKGAAPPARGSGLPRRSISPAPAFGRSVTVADAQLQAAASASRTDRPASHTAQGHQKPATAAVDVPSPSVSPQARGGKNSRLPRLSPTSSPSPSPSPTKHQLRAQLAAAEASPSPGDFKFPTAAAREPSVDTPTFAESDLAGDMADDNSFAFGAVSSVPGDSAGIHEWQKLANGPSHPPDGDSGAQLGNSSSQAFGNSSSRAFASRLDDFNPPQSPPNLRLPDGSPTGASGSSALPPVSEAAPDEAHAQAPAPAPAPGQSLRKSRSGRNRVPTDVPLPIQLKNRRKAGGTPPPPSGPSLAGVAAAARAQQHRVSESSAMDSRKRISSVNGQDDLLALYASTDLSEDAGGLSRVNTGHWDPSADDALGTGSGRRAISPISQGHSKSPAATKGRVVASNAARGLHATKNSGGGSAFNLAEPNAAAQGANAPKEASGAPGRASGAQQSSQSAFEEVAAKVWNTSVSDMDSESNGGVRRTFQSTSTADGAGGSRPTLATAVSAGANAIPSRHHVSGQHSRAHSTSEVHNEAHNNASLSAQPHIEKHRSSRFEDTAQWLTIRNRELQDLEVTMHELNQMLLAGGASADLPGPAGHSTNLHNSNPAGTGNSQYGNPTADSSAFASSRTGGFRGSSTGPGFGRSISMRDTQGTAAAPQRGRPPSGGGGASALMAQQYAEMEAELAQLPARRRRATSAAPPQSRGAVSMSMDGFLMAERLANGGWVGDGSGLGSGAPNAAQQGHGQSISLPGQAVLDSAAAAAAAARGRSATSSSEGSTMGLGTSSGGGSPGTGIAFAQRNASRSPVGRIRKPTVGPTLSPLPEKGKWADPVRTTSMGFQPKPASAIAESFAKQQQKNGARQGLRAPKAAPGARSRSAHPAPLRRTNATNFPAGTQPNMNKPRALAEASKLPSAAGVLAEPPRPLKSTGLTQSVGAGRGPDHMSTNHASNTTPSNFPMRMGSSMGTGPAVPGSPYLASPAAAKNAASRSRSSIGELRPSNAKARATAAASGRKR